MAVPLLVASTVYERLPLSSCSMVSFKTPEIPEADTKYRVRHIMGAQIGLTFLCAWNNTAVMCLSLHSHQSWPYTIKRPGQTPVVAPPFSPLSLPIYTPMCTRYEITLLVNMRVVAQQEHFVSQEPSRNQRQSSIYIQSGTVFKIDLIWNDYPLFLTFTFWGMTRQVESRCTLSVLGGSDKGNWFVSMLIQHDVWLPPKWSNMSTL